MFKDITGKKINRLTVLEKAPSMGKTTYWLCRCDCGSEKIIRAPSLNQNKVISCGCALTEALNRRNTTHGKSGSLTHRIWLGMLSRCTNPNVEAYSRYGGRGIKICPEWLVFENFLKDMGEAPTKMTIERKDNNGNYEPCNCKWATRKEQANNRKTSHLITFNGETKTIAEWAETQGIPLHTLKRRILYGTWSIGDILTKRFLPRVRAPR